MLVFVERMRHRYAVDLMLRVLGVAPSTYYGWVRALDRPSDHAEVDLGLLSVIYEIWTESGRTYGSDRIWGRLRRDGIRVGRKRVERLMAGQGWAGSHLRKGWKHPKAEAEAQATPACDLVERHFTAEGPDRLWLADASRIATDCGVVWVAAIRDAFSNRIAGWATGPSCNTDLIAAALSYALWSKDIRNGQLIHHSDRGSNYTSLRFSQMLSDNGIRRSMGSVGDSFDNALMENFWSTLKIEVIYGKRWSSPSAVEEALFLYVDGWYNSRRIQKKLGYRSPEEFETAWKEEQATKHEALPQPRQHGV
ncbi:IS3 family transposase [Glycomyces sp. A-F 0318]|uniref:IS3 family transposase n=1 Tax=Glycomyces amatae TaxID=2881355 RepID=UPI001E2F7D92|nr:IS3 family transposase [Glycomyces amatae]